jgi:hypothetical protein
MESRIVTQTQCSWRPNCTGITLTPRRATFHSTKKHLPNIARRGCRVYDIPVTTERVSDLMCSTHHMHLEVKL